MPSVTSTTNLTVDEDGFLATRNLDDVPVAANETDSTESLTDTTGVAKVTFGNDVPANLLGSIVLVDTGAALDTQLTTLAGNPVVFALEAATGDLVGKDGATEVIRIHITGASLTNAATGEVSYTYSTTLSQPVKHASLDGLAGDNSENSALLSGVTFAVTDKDTSTTQGTFNVTIVDDVPSAVADGPLTPAEDTAITFSVTGNDVFGADGVDLLTGVAVTAAAGKGTAVYNGDGTFTYTPTAGQTGSDSFTYTITDRDGDSSTATVSITLAADSVPSVTSTTNLTVDEDGFLATRNLDDVPVAANETDSTESLTDTTGVAKVTFGNDVPANLLGSIVLVDTGAALDTQLTTLAGNPVVFALEAATGDLVGKDGATEVIRIHITGASLTNAATGEVSYTYSTTLSQPVKHASLDGLAGDNSENSALLSGVTFAVTDKDTDTTQGTFNVTIVDDVPSAVADGPLTPAEDTAITFSVTGNDVFGADGVDLLTGVAVTTAAGKGTAVYNGDGTFTYTPTAGQEGLDTFQYTITDQDGDTSTATVSITLAADSVPSVTSTTNLTVDEDGFLATRNLDDVPVAANKTDSTESLTDTTGVAKVTFGNDVPANLLGSIVLVDTGAALDTQLTTLAGNPVVFALEAATGDLVGKDGATEVIRIHITGASLTNAATGEVSYTYSTTLSQPVKHASLDGLAGDNSENSALLSGVTFAVTDKDTSTTQGTFNVTIVDDVPSAVADGPLTPAEDTAITFSVTGNDVFGADGVDLLTGVAVTAAAGKGTAVYNGDGTFTYTPTAGQTGSDSFTYTITDRDGDSSTATVSITLAAEFCAERDLDDQPDG